MPDERSWKRLVIALSFVATFFLLVTVTIAAFTGRASGYEISIYKSYPWYFWTLIIASIFLLQIALIIHTYFVKTGRTKLPTLLALVTMDFLLMLLPLIRGYWVYGRGDVLSHLGYIGDIERSASIGADTYPMDHLLAYTIASTARMSAQTTVMVIQTFFFVLFLVFFYLLAGLILRRRSDAVMATVFACILMFGYKSVAFAPFIQSVYFFPVVLYIVLRTSNASKPLPLAFVSMIAILFATFLHPLSTLVLIIVLLILAANRSMAKRGRDFHNVAERDNSARLAGLASVVFLAWQGYAYSLVRTLSGIYEFLQGGPAESEFQRYGGSFENLFRQGWLQVVWIFVNQYGQLMILGIVAIACARLIFSKRVTEMASKQEYGCNTMFVLHSFIALAAISIGIFFLAYVVEFDRGYVFAALFSILLVSLYFGRALRNKGSLATHWIRLTLVGAVLFLVLSFAIFSLFMSPRTDNVNQQVCNSEINGMEFFLQHRNNRTLTMEWLIDQERFFDALYGHAAPKVNMLYGWAETNPPNHFGYENGTSLASSYSEPRYLLLTSLGRDFYPSMFPDNPKDWKFTEDDFADLSKDTGVELVYANGNLQVFLTTVS
jgi:hypothetical protein